MHKGLRSGRQRSQIATLENHIPKSALPVNFVRSGADSVNEQRGMRDNGRESGRQLVCPYPGCMDKDKPCKTAFRGTAQRDSGEIQAEIVSNAL